MSDRGGVLPNLVVIGAPKCGTTSLHYYLGRHPAIVMSRRKELNFFLDGRRPRPPGGAADGLDGFEPVCNWRRGTDWYRSWFRAPGAVHGESSPNYANRFLFDGVPGRLHGLLPEARLIYMVRDPVERVLSQYVHCRCDGIETRPFEACIAHLAPENPYLGYSLYHAQLEAFRAFYPADRILLADLSELHRQREAFLRRCFRFLGVDETFTTPEFQVVRHASAGKPRKGPVGLWLKRVAEQKLGWLFPEAVRIAAGRALYGRFGRSVPRPVISAERRRALEAFFREDARRLREATGQAFRHWSV